MMPSRKEIISYILLITAVSCTWQPISDLANLPSFVACRPQFLCVLNASVFTNILPLHASYEQVAAQVVSVGTAYICLIYAMSTWLYHSNYHRARLEMRLVVGVGVAVAVALVLVFNMASSQLVAMIIAMICCNIMTTYFFKQDLLFKKLAQCTDMRSLFSTFAMASRDVSLALSIICILLLFVALVMIIVKIFMSQRKRRRAQLKDMV